ncbi:MAG: hypothetical protein HZA91_15780 [Verrucomicrobia bacterium]|nr:hypothetical protein [Verrucomicrobiota bacterium]
MTTNATSLTTPPRRHWWLPSVGVCLWLALFLVVTLTEWRPVLINSDGDPCWHWRNGNWMIEHSAVVRSDLYSHTRPGAPLVTKEWLAEIFYATAGNALGWGGIVALAAALIATTLWLLYRQLVAEGRDALLSALLVGLAALACSIHWLARSLLVTHLMAVVFAANLRAFEHGRVPAQRLFALLVPLMALWANLHGGFLTGIALIGMFAAGDFIQLMLSPHEERPAIWQKIGTLLALAVACLFASLLNPNGWGLHAHILDFVRPGVHPFTSEFQSPNFHDQGTLGFLLLLLAMLAMFLVARPRLNPTDLLLLAAWSYLSLRAARNEPIFAIVATPILAEHWSAWLSRPRNEPRPAMAALWQRLTANFTAMQRVADGRVLAAIVALGVVFALAKPLVPTGIQTDRFPVAAVQWLKKNPGAVRGEMFNEMRWGGYLILAMPERKVFVDSRDDFYGSFMREYLTVDGLWPGWEKVLDARRVGWTLSPRAHPLNQMLALRPDWTPVYADDVAVIFGRVARAAQLRRTRP